MYETVKPRISPLLPLLLALLLAACTPAGGETPPLAGASIGGPFTLTDQDGRPRGSDSFDGKYRLVYFGYTFCPDICPVDLQQIGLAVEQLEKSDPAKAAKLQPIFITTDPERDTPAVLKDYVAAFHPRLVGLTGSPDQIAKVAKAHGVWFSKQEQGGASGYLVDHSRIAFLFGPKGEPIAILSHDKGADTIAAELDRWVS